MADSQSSISSEAFPCRHVYLTELDPLLSTVEEELVDAFRRGHCVPFAGAGISAAPPSCLPLAGALMHELRRTLWASIIVFARSNQARFCRSEARRIIREVRLERLLYALQETHGPAAIHQFLSLLRSSAWNQNHAALAALAAEGFLPTCVTLNFDLLLEEAASAHGITSETICPLSDAAFRHPAGGTTVPSIRIFKPHGSLVPRGDTRDEFGLLAPTLAEIGNQPDRRNHEVLRKVFSAGQAILVVGYSDNDWDIFPILEDLTGGFSHIYWVHYEAPSVVASRGPLEVPMPPRLRDWLRRRGENATLLIGDPRFLFGRVCAAGKVVCKDPDRTNVPRSAIRGDTQQFSNTERAKLATATAFALLLQDRGRFHERLVKWLLDLDSISSHPDLAAQLHRTAAHSCHTRRDLSRALCHMNQAVLLSAKADGPNNNRLADDLLWIGYEHLCLVKRPGVRWFALLPVVWHIRRGREQMEQAVLLARHLTRRHRRKIRALYRFYLGDLLHTWAGLLLLVNPFMRFGAVQLLRRASALYDKAKRIDPITMNWEYYWLRTLEAQLLGGERPADIGAAMTRIEQIGESYKMLQNHVQLGNALAYRALVGSSTGMSRMEMASLLDEAEEIWAAGDGFVPSGLLRVISFRRLLRIRGFGSTLRDLFRFWRSVRAHSKELGGAHRVPTE